MPLTNPSEPFLRAKAIQHPDGADEPIQLGSVIEFLNAEHALEFLNSLGGAVGTVFSVAGRSGAVVLSSADLSDVASLATVSYVDGRFTDLLGLTPDTLDTLAEIAARIVEDEDSVAAISSSLAAKADSATVTAALAGKADSSALAAKADASAVTASLAGKANTSLSNLSAATTARSNLGLAAFNSDEYGLILSGGGNAAYNVPLGTRGQFLKVPTAPGTPEWSRPLNVVTVGSIGEYSTVQEAIDATFYSIVLVSSEPESFTIPDNVTLRIFTLNAAPIDGDIFMREGSALIGAGQSLLQVANIKTPADWPGGTNGPTILVEGIKVTGMIQSTGGVWTQAGVGNVGSVGGNGGAITCVRCDLRGITVSANGGDGQQGGNGAAGVPTDLPATNGYFRLSFEAAVWDGSAGSVDLYDNIALGTVHCEWGSGSPDTVPGDLVVSGWTITDAMGAVVTITEPGSGEPTNLAATAGSTGQVIDLVQGQPEAPGMGPGNGSDALAGGVGGNGGDIRLRWCFEPTAMVVGPGFGGSSGGGGIGVNGGSDGSTISPAGNGGDGLTESLYGVA